MLRIGQKLLQVRKQKGYTIEEVAKATRIQPRFIEALEKGDYKKLPSSAYVQGFIRNYAEYLGLPTRETLAIFRREFDEREYLGVLPESFTKKQQPLPGFRLGTVGISIVAGIFLVVAFIFFQYRAAFFSPGLDISSPKENATITEETVTVVGKTDPNTTVTINDAPVYIDKDGSFTKEVGVFNGPTTITAKSVNNFGKISTVIRHILVSLKAQ